jgi:hypothetical protein
MDSIICGNFLNNWGTGSFSGRILIPWVS